MNTRFIYRVLMAIVPLPFFAAAQQPAFPVVTQSTTACIVYNATGPKLDSIAAGLLAADIERVTGVKPEVFTDITRAKGAVIAIGSASDNMIQQLAGNKRSLLQKLNHQWEQFGLTIIDKPLPGISKALVVAGSDARGTAYGVFTLSEKMGVSPWYWWADAPVRHQQQLLIHQPDSLSASPSVKYRGIFINDEDWGLQPWAAKTFEPETKDIGPKTYARVFELLLRLKANLIWPAMHPSTKAFFYYPGNVTTAGDYQIVIGSSHAEPMLRNNVDEWHEKTMGHFNYLTNKDSIYQYWEARVKQSSEVNAIYTMGMRGVHDGQMEGVKNMKEAVPIVERIIEDERGLLRKYVNKEVTAVPQVLTPYKEVLDIYDNGLKVPDDITLVWPDDNYGYIQRLNTEAEKKRSGGAGVYYHASYWGRPHDYLWLPSANPALMREEMIKAYNNGASRLWVLNVGDIKPNEYNMQFFLDMAYRAAPFQQAGYEQQYLHNWCSRLFNGEATNRIAAVLQRYYSLAFERKPEFMGWSQTEPTTPTRLSGYNHFSYGDEAQQRINAFDSLEWQVKQLRNQVSGAGSDALYQLVYYPVMSASAISKKFLYRDKAWLYAQQNRISAYRYAALSKLAYDSIVTETAFYNQQLNGGKWQHMMSMQPRDLPVYLAPVLPAIQVKKGSGWDVLPEGYDTLAYAANKPKAFPAFTQGVKQRFFADLFLRDSASVSWQAQKGAAWITLSAEKGTLIARGDESTARIWAEVDWTKAPIADSINSTVTFEVNGHTETIAITGKRPALKEYASYKGFTEQNGMVSIYAAHFTNNKSTSKAQWKQAPGLGHTALALKSQVQGKADTLPVASQSACVTYTFFSLSAAAPRLRVYTLPTHPLNKDYSMRYAVSIDNGPLQVTNFRTYGRSEEWKQNVLRNTAIREWKLAPLSPGIHQVKIYAIDPEVIIDRLLIQFNNAPVSYGLLPETVK